jgi:hypothetical protein
MHQHTSNVVTKLREFAEQKSDDFIYNEDETRWKYNKPNVSSKTISMVPSSRSSKVSSMINGTEPSSKSSRVSMINETEPSSRSSSKSSMINETEPSSRSSRVSSMINETEPSSRSSRVSSMINETEPSSIQLNETHVDSPNIQSIIESLIAEPTSKQLMVPSSRSSRVSSIRNETEPSSRSSRVSSIRNETEPSSRSSRVSLMRNETEPSSIQLNETPTDSPNIQSIVESLIAEPTSKKLMVPSSRSSRVSSIINKTEPSSRSSMRNETPTDSPKIQSIIESLITEPTSKELMVPSNSSSRIQSSRSSKASLRQSNKLSPTETPGTELVQPLPSNIFSQKSIQEQMDQGEETTNSSYLKKYLEYKKKYLELKNIN